MLLDMHMVHAVLNGWTVYRDSLVAFRGLFPTLGDAVTLRWHTLLVDEPPAVRSAFAPGTPEGLPLVTIELTGESVENRAMSNRLGTTSTPQHELGFGVRQTTEVTIMSKRDETLRALAVIVRAVLLRAVPSFQRSDYEDLRYEGMGELSLDEMLVAEELGVSVIRLRYSAQSSVVVLDPPTGALTSKPWFVQLDDVVEAPGDPAPATGAGTPGGVTPDND